MGKKGKGKSVSQDPNIEFKDSDEGLYNVFVGGKSIGLVEKQSTNYWQARPFPVRTRKAAAEQLQLLAKNKK